MELSPELWGSMVEGEWEVGEVLTSCINDAFFVFEQCSAIRGELGGGVGKWLANPQGTEEFLEVIAIPKLLDFICLVPPTILYFSEFLLFFFLFRYLKWSFFECGIPSFCHSIKALHFSFCSLLICTMCLPNQSWWTHFSGPRTICLNWVNFSFESLISGPWACSVLVESEKTFSLPSGCSSWVVFSVAWVSIGFLWCTDAM